MDLASESGRDWRFTNWAFCNSLRLAKKYGWKPKSDLNKGFDMFLNNDEVKKRNKTSIINHMYC